MTLLAAAVGAAPAVSPAATAAPAVENPDTHFYQKAAESNLAEVDAGMLAQQRGGSAAVKNFGQMMVKDHSAANHTLRELATTNHVDLPDQPNAEQRAKRSALQSLSGDAFDSAYVEAQILAHKDAIAAFKEESASGDDLAARQFATETLPTIQGHLKVLLAMPITATASPATAPAQPAPN